jgi:aspartate/methionine/tyrosine aminotransferase/acyl-CoA synthetase (AMP-forming)/AMP-acid ligase II
MEKQDAITWLKKIPKKNIGKVFLIDDISGSKITFDQLEVEACRIGSSLYELGLKKGDHLAIILNNSPSLVKLYFGCLYAGIVVIPVNPTSALQEIEYIINHSKVKNIVVSPETEDKVNVGFFKENGIRTLNIIDGVNPDNISPETVPWKFDELKSNSKFEPFHQVTSNDDMAIVYTSGTTAEPKAVVHSIADFVDNAREFGEIIGINSKNRFYNLLALTYLGGYYNLLFLPYVCESSVVLTNNFNPNSIINFWKPIISNKVNTLWLVPSIISILLEFDRGTDGNNYCKNNINYALVGTAPLPSKLKDNFENRYGIKLYENYGMTETLFISTTSPSFTGKEGSVGKILPSVKTRIVNNEKIISENEEGEIQIKTPYLMDGYYQNNKENQHLITDETWFDTGDLGIFSKEQELFITGRKKDLIIRGGINISPVAIENVLYKHDSIRECAVIGVPHKFQGEEIIAVVSLKSDGILSTIHDELLKICREYLPSFKQPSQIVQLPELPHNTSGKILKAKIRTWFLQRQLSSFDQKYETKTVSESILKKKGFLPSKIVSNSIQALSIKYNNIVYEKQRAGEDIIVLSLGEAFFDIPLNSFGDLPYPQIFHYSHSRGIPELREKISKYFSETYDVTFDDEEEIMITAGSKAAIHMSLMTVIDPGDEVIIHEPAWVSFPEQIKLCYGVPVQIPYNKTVFDFENYISEKTKMIIINNPNNPTGKVYNLEEMSHIYQLAKKYNLFVLSDEAYSDFVLNKDEFISFAELDTEKKHTIIINSLSKNFGMSGWRLGYMISNKELINQTLKINQHLITCPSTILEYYMVKHFDDILRITKPQIKKLIEKRSEINKFLDSLSLKPLPGTSTFYFFISIAESNLSSEEFSTKLLNDYHVSTAPGIGYGKSCDKFIRISIGSENIERVKKGIESIKDLISKTKTSN